MTEQERAEILAEADKALNCLYIAVEKSIAGDVDKKVRAALALVSDLIKEESGG